MAHEYNIVCEDNINFYGGIEGNGSIVLYADNFTVQINGNKFNGNVANWKGIFIFTFLLHSIQIILPNLKKLF